MKLDTRTLQVLKNFSTINPSILIRKGNYLSTVSPVRSIITRAKVDIEFENTFAIYDLSKFLSTLSLFEDPELTVNEKTITIRGKNNVVNYTLAEAATIISAPETLKEFPEPEVSFKLTNDSLTSVMKGMGVLRLPEIAVTGDRNDIMLQAIDSKNPSGDVYSIVVGKTDKKFRAILRAENIKLLTGDYDVDITSKGIARFTGNDIMYLVAVEANSTF